MVKSLLKNASNSVLLAAILSAVLMAWLCPALAAEPLSWVRKPNQPTPAQFDVFHGESLDFRCTFTGFGALPFAGDDAPRLYYQTNGMGTAWWSIPATVSSNMLSATFPPSADPGAERLSVFFGAPSNAYAAAQVRFRNSPGATPNYLAPPSILDWQSSLAATTNALWNSSTAAFMPQTNTYTKAETDARIGELAPRTSLEPATNYTDAAVSALEVRLVEGDITVYDSMRAVALDGSLDNRTADQIFAQLDAASRITTNDVCAIATNVVPEYTTHDTWVCNNPIGQPWAPIWNGTGWYVSILDRTFPSDATTFAIIDAESPEPGFGDFIFTRVPASTRNALGLARLSEIPSTNGFISAVTATNIAEAAVEQLSNDLGDGTFTVENASSANWAEHAVYLDDGSHQMTIGDVLEEIYNSTEGLLSVESDPIWDAAKAEYATTGTVAQVSEAVGTLWSYVYGDSVWIAVTNYMRTIGGVSPSFQLWEVRDGATNLVYWSKEEITNVTHDLIYDCKTNLEATVRNAVAEMPDKAWSRYQSATGNEAPDGVTIVSTPTIQLTGGGEWYRYVDVSSNSVWFLKSNGLHTFGGDTNGYFRILDDEGNATFEVRKTDSYLVDAVASSVHFDENGNFCVSFQSNIEPVIYTTASLESPNFLPQGDDPNVTVTWTQSGGTYTATLEQAVKGPSLFAYAKVEVQGETVIRNTVPTDLQGGIIVNGVKYNVGTATINGNTVLTLTPRN